MTQGISAEGSNPCPAVGMEGWRLVNPAGETTSAALFAQLLTAAENLIAPVELEQPALPPRDKPPSTASAERLTADEVSRQLAMLGLPGIVASTPTTVSAPIPEAVASAAGELNPPSLTGTALLPPPIVGATGATEPSAGSKPVASGVAARVLTHPAVPADDSAKAPRLTLQATAPEALPAPPPATEPPVPAPSADAAPRSEPTRLANLAAAEVSSQRQESGQPAPAPSPGATPSSEPTRHANLAPAEVAAPQQETGQPAPASSLGATPLSEPTRPTNLIAAGEPVAPLTAEKVAATRQAMPGGTPSPEVPLPSGTAPTPTGEAVSSPQGNRSEGLLDGTVGVEGSRPQAKRSTEPAVERNPVPSEPTEAPLPHPHGVEAAHATSRGHAVTSPPAEASPAEVVRQVARQIESLTSGRGASSVTLQLEPEHLGRLRVTISLSEGTVHARIVAESPLVRQMLENHSSLLHQALQERGLQLGALQVFVQGEGRQFLTYQAYAAPTMGRGWLRTEDTALAAGEGNLWLPRTGGVNLLV